MTSKAPVARTCLDRFGRLDVLVMETRLTEKLIDANRQPIIDTIPLGRMNAPEDIAVVVAFLATVEPNFITGGIIDVDGGQPIN